MNNVTQRLLDTGNFTLHNEGEWSKTVSKYSAFNDAGVEVEVGEFLYAMVRILKPEAVLETGTHVGVGACYMGTGLQENGFGVLDTVEFLPELHAKAVERIHNVGLDNYVKLHLIDAKDFVSQKVYDLILLDTEPQTRFAELLKYYLFLKEGGYIFIHDLHRHMQQVENAEHGFAWPYGVIPEQMKLLIKNGQLRPFHFGTPRGLTGFYKVSSDDYVWR